MGESYKLSCPQCGYASKMVHLGQGMAMDTELILGTCNSCKELTHLPIDKNNGDCSFCRSESKVTPTNHKEAKKRVGFLSYKKTKFYECPSCSHFSLDIPEIPEESWD